MAKRIKRNWLLTFVDTTDQWHLEDVCGELPEGVTIREAFIYDPAEETHLCEMTASRCLYPVGNILTLDTPKAEGWYEALDEETREALGDAVETEGVNFEPTYMHSSRVPVGVDTENPVEYYSKKDEGTSRRYRAGETNWEDVQEGISEACSANSYLWEVLPEWQELQAKKPVAA
jgi:hypothetical protein